MCGVSPPSSDWVSTPHGQLWLNSAGGFLPAPESTCTHVLLRLTGDPDEVPFSVPAWCCWSDSGLVSLPQGHALSMSPRGTLQRIAGVPRCGQGIGRWRGAQWLLMMNESDEVIELDSTFKCM